MSDELEKLETEAKTLRKVITQSDIASATKMQEIAETEHWLASNIKGAGKAYYSEKELELYKLKDEVNRLNNRQQLAEKRLAGVEEAKATDIAKALRSQLSEDVIELSKLHAKTRRAIKSAGKSYLSLFEKEESIFTVGAKAADWPSDTFRYRRAGEASFHFAICCIAKEFGLDSRTPIEIPNPKKCLEGSTFEGAFKSFKYLRDSWEYPERFEEIDPETVEYEAATDADFDDGPEDKGASNA
ncbi:hypothetical protein N9L40_03925 [Rhodobacteraceae bacterium]|nr:hypothetical protein [Paracoccaceae bacterium]